MFVLMMQVICFGSSIIEIWIKEGEEEKKIVFTGDLGNNDIPLLASPTMIESADYLVMESTYGSRLHMRNDDKAEMFLDIVSETLDNGGTVVIPSFAVGRTQEILYEINKLKEKRNDEEFRRKYKTLMRTPVYVDSPLAISATEVFKENMNLFDEDVKHAIASGMCEVGRIKHHLKHNLWNPKSTILFVGYQAPGTLGSRIVNGEKKVKIFGEEIAVNARIEYIEGYSGHADQEWLLNFVYSFITKPKHIFLVHGEPEAQEVLKQKIEEETKIPVEIPSFGETYKIEDLQVEVINKLELPNKEIEGKQIALEKLRKIKEEVLDMEEIIKEEILTKDAKDEDVKVLNLRLKELENQIVRIIQN